MAAIEAARGAKEFNVKLDVIVLESSSRVLQKVKISGGGRCNVLHDEQKSIKTISEGSVPC
jgi:predicted flavoprotein YhiN